MDMLLHDVIVAIPGFSIKHFTVLTELGSYKTCSSGTIMRNRLFKHC